MKLHLNNLSSPQLLKLFNEMTGHEVKKFATKDAGIKRVEKCFKDLAPHLWKDTLMEVLGDELGKKICPEAFSEATAAVKGKKKPKADGDKSKGRDSYYAGKKIYREQKENPRRPGTHGAKSWDLITEGMTYEEFLALGGRNRDLRHDVMAKRITMK